MILKFDEIKMFESNEGTVRKYVFSNEKAVAEAVLYRYPDYQTRTVICCSVMSGCPVGCRFCGAGDNFVGTLTSGQIIQQVEHLVEETGVLPAGMGQLQIMFMSMGEPFLNWHSLDQALCYLNQMYPNAQLLVSTIGPHFSHWGDFISLSKNIDKIGLQFSIHMSTDEARNRLIPFNAKFTLEEIAALGELWHDETERHPFFNYCAGPDNSAEVDVLNLMELFDPSVWKATVSVICERNDGMPSRSGAQIELARDFASMLVEYGYDVRVFDPAGQDDIGGGCGQLWFVQNWMKEHPQQCRASIGMGKPVVHAPKE